MLAEGIDWEVDTGPHKVEPVGRGLRMEDKTTLNVRSFWVMIDSTSTELQMRKLFLQHKVSVSGS